MSTTLQFSVEDINTVRATYVSIRLYRATNQYGNYAALADITLSANTYHYTYEDNSGDINKWYKYSYYNSIGPVESGISAPFRPEGTTLQRIRQRAITEYGAGVVFAASAGTNNTVITTDFRLLSSSLFSTSKGKGTWLYRPGEDNPINSRMIVNYNPVSGELTIGADWAANPNSGDEMEWHWLANPVVWNQAIERACRRCWYIDRVPIPGVANQGEYNLNVIAPWLTNRRSVHDLRYYPERTSAGADNGIDRSWGAGGRWWAVKTDQHVLTLQISPPVDASTLLYLEASRTAEPLYSEAAAPPLVCEEDYLTGLAYDEVLAYLVHPNTGAAQDQARWASERIFHNRTRLAKLIDANKLNISRKPELYSSPVVVPSPWGAR